MFDGYWEDIGTVKAFYEANLSLAGSNPPFNMNVPDCPIYTRPRFLPCTQLDSASVSQSMIADGCHISRGAVIENSVIGVRCVIGQNVSIKNTVIMGADFYESQRTMAQARRENQPPLGIGDGSRIEGAILDKNCRIGKNVQIVNTQKIENRGEDEACIIRDGIPAVAKDGVLPDGWKL